jgi:hypothetical protein
MRWRVIFLCIPGSGLAAYGLWRQIKDQIEPLDMPRIGRMFKVAAGALVAYSILGGLLVPELPFFPANAIRHAHTPRVEIRLTCASGRPRLSIQDFGRGIPAAARAGYGLRNMRDRARLLGGILNIESSASKGTLVTLDLSVEEYEKSHPGVDCG